MVHTETIYYANITNRHLEILQTFLGGTIVLTQKFIWPEGTSTIEYNIIGINGRYTQFENKLNFEIQQVKNGITEQYFGFDNFFNSFLRYIDKLKNDGTIPEYMCYFSNIKLPQHSDLVTYEIYTSSSYREQERIKKLEML